MSQPTTALPTLDIWSKTPADFIAERKNHRSPKKTKHWGVRYAIYAALLALGLQTVGSLTYLLLIVNNLVNEGIDPAAAQLMAMKELSTPSLPMLLIQLSMYVAWVGTMLYVTFRKGLHSFAKDFWVRFRWSRDIPFGIAIALGLRGAEWAVMTGLEALGVDLTGANNTKSFIGDNIWAYIMMFGVAAFLGPICEELFFRGLLMQGLIKTFRRRASTPRTWFGRMTTRVFPTFWKAYVGLKNVLYKNKYALAVAISTVAFGFSHYQGFETFGQWMVIIETGTIGLVLALMTLKTRRLGLSISTHVAFNTSAMVMVVLGLGG